MSKSMIVDTIPEVTGDCPYCGSNDVTIGSYMYTSVGTRNPSYRCKDCNRSFSFSTYASDTPKKVYAEEVLTDLQTLGFVEQIDENKFRITDTGKEFSKNYKHGNRLEIADNLILNIPFWKNVVANIPTIHPSKEAFFAAVKTVLKDSIPNGTTLEWLWHRFDVEIVPALERRQKIPGVPGFIGVTLNPSGVPS